ncbi:MAG: GDP-mannose 4,6-dehydratase [Patescibacteria group bacterium]
MNVFITGISGFAGSYLAKHLLYQGANVFGLVRRKADWSVPHILEYLGINEKVSLLEGDICDISIFMHILPR